MIVPQLDYRSPHLLLATDPMAPEKTTKVSKRDIAAHRKSAVSIMPDGLLNTLTREEILDLIGCIGSGGALR